ncbi:hypothetical protein NFI96_000470 [Prochilodus magdalenae]|nr:hypothetical protein NFI96_000470 [Prochilodus magdalenae]
MASLPSGGAPSLSLRHGARCEPAPGTSVEEVLLGVGEQIGCEKIVSASRMNKAVVIFLSDETLVNRLVESGVWVNGVFLTVSPLVAPTVKVTISNVPPFIPNADIERELSRFGRFSGGIRMVPLACKNAGLKHVLSFRRHAFMFLEDPALDVSFRVWHEGRSFMVYATTGGLRCFECGDVGHKRQTCPHKANREEAAGPSAASAAGVSNAEQGTGGEDEARLSTAGSEEAAVSEGTGEERDQAGGAVEEGPETHESQKPGPSEEAGPPGPLDEGVQVRTGNGDTQESGLTEAPVEEEETDMEDAGDDDTGSVFSGISEVGSQPDEADLYSVQEINTPSWMRPMWRVQKHSFESLSQWWDVGKAQIRAFCQGYSAHAASSVRLAVKKLQRDIEDLEKRIDGNSGEGLQGVLAVKRQELGSYLQEQQKQMFFLRHGDGTLTSDPAEMRSLAVRYYAELYGAEECDGDSAADLLQGLPQLSPGQREELDSDIAFEELTAAVKQLSTGRSPGVDGLPAEFYQRFWTVLGRDFYDVEKAFDRVDHGYLFNTLAAFGCGDKFVGWLRLLYNEAAVMVKVGGALSVKVPVQRGIRQGCPLSGQLYSLVIEPLLCRLRRDLRGVPTTSDPSGTRVSLSAYADDVTVLVTAQEDVEALESSLEVYEKASSAKVNWERFSEKMVAFFWSGQHWIRAAVLFLPVAEGGQGLVDIQSRVKAFRLQSVKRLLYQRDLPWTQLAGGILHRAGGLGYDLQLFWIRLAEVSLSGLTPFYRSLLQVWKTVFEVSRGAGLSGAWIREEPLLYNPLLQTRLLSSSSIRACLLRSGCTKLGHVLQTNGWRSPTELRKVTGLYSPRLVTQLLEEVESVLPGCYRELVVRGGTLDRQAAGAPAPNLTVRLAVQLDQEEETVPGTLFHIPALGRFQEVPRDALYLACVKVAHQAVLKRQRLSHWPRIVRTRLPPEGQHFRKNSPDIQATIQKDYTSCWLPLSNRPAMDIYEDMAAIRPAQLRNLGRQEQTTPANPEDTSKPSWIWLYKIVVAALVLFCFLLIILIIALRAAAAAPTNPTRNLEQVLEHGWMYFNYSLYHLSNESMPWLAAREECKRKNAELVCINSKEEQEFIQSFLKESAWVGLTNMYSELQWVDGTPEKAMYWDSGPYVSECMKVLETKLMKDPCRIRNKWICEKPVYRR